MRPDDFRLLEQRLAGAVASARAAVRPPDDHFIARPDSRVMVSPGRRASRGGLLPAIGHRIVMTSRVDRASVGRSTPDDHFIARPDSRMNRPGRGGSVYGDGSPAVRRRVVPASRVEITGIVLAGASPDDHFTSGPDRGV